MTPPVVDYRQLRPSNLTEPRFRHLLYLLYWPLYGLLFMYVERFSPIEYYYPIYSPLDDYIPFCELFVIPYMFWFAYLVIQHAYGLFYDIAGFKWLMRYIIITYSAAIIIYLLFPNCQELRPVEFPRDNFLTRFMAGFYQFDTNTNVCPSIHVIGSVAVCCTAFSMPRFQSRGWKWAFGATAVLICMSTVFLKQHSAVDVLAALPVCLAAYHIAFRKEAFHGRR